MFRDFYSGKRVFLTGHTGFKGSWLAEWLLMLGAKAGQIRHRRQLFSDGTALTRNGRRGNQETLEARLQWGGHDDCADD